MPIKKYADEPVGLYNRIDLQNEAGGVTTSTMVTDITSTGLEHTIELGESKWEVEEVALSFSGAAARNISIAKLSGANIIAGRNDRFWISVAGMVTQRVTLDPGFYDETTFPVEVKAKLDSVFSSLSVTFTVAYAAGKMTITNSGALSMVFYMVNERTGVRKNSTAAANMGFTTDQTGTTLTADVATGIGTSFAVISATGDTSTSYVVTDNITMDSDSRLVVSTSTAAITVTSKITYSR